MAKFVTKRNDTKPIEATLQRRDRTSGAFVPADLTGGSVRFLMRRLIDDAAVVAALATILDAPNGSVSYAFAPSETAVAGEYRGEFELTQGGVVETFPAGSYIPIVIVEDLG